MDTDINYDSDAIDEDLEASLYASVYFDNEEYFPPEPIVFGPTDDLLIKPTEDEKQASDNGVFKAPLPLSSTTTDNNPFSWNLPCDSDKRVTSLSSLADAIYLTLTGVLPPSVVEASNRFCSASSSIYRVTAQLPTSSFANDDEKTPNTDASNSVMFTLADSESSSDGGSVSSEYSKKHKSPESDESNIEDSQIADTSDIILGVSSAAKHSYSDSVAEISEMLSNTSSDPKKWYLDPSDRVPCRRNNRYYNPSRNVICSTCFRKDHSAAECERSGPVCILCGREGHTSDKCSNQYCSVCLKPGHGHSGCPLKYKMRLTTCSRCQQAGHTLDICSEIWRQYKVTTRHGRPVIPKFGLQREKSCCNCGRSGHTSDNCRARPFRGKSLVRRAIRIYDKRNVYSGSLACSSLQEETNHALTPRQETNLSLLRRRRLSWPQQQEEGSSFQRRQKASTRKELRQQKHLEKSKRRVERKLFEQSLQQVTSSSYRTWEGESQSGPSYSTPLTGESSSRYEEPLVLSFAASPSAEGTPGDRGEGVGGPLWATPIRGARKRRADGFAVNNNNNARNSSRASLKKFPKTSSAGSLGEEKVKSLSYKKSRLSTNNSFSTPSLRLYDEEDGKDWHDFSTPFRRGSSSSSYGRGGKRFQNMLKLPNIASPLWVNGSNTSPPINVPPTKKNDLPVEQELWYKTIVAAPTRIASWKSPKNETRVTPDHRRRSKPAGGNINTSQNGFI